MNNTISYKNSAARIHNTATCNAVIGMSEFQLSVSLNALTTNATLVFIASSSKTPSPYSSMKNSPAKLTRTFTSQKSTRSIYFSVTNAYSNTPVGTVDLATGTEQALIKDNFPGILVPGETYYVHAYHNGQSLQSSHPSLRRNILAHYLLRSPMEGIPIPMPYGAWICG